MSSSILKTSLATAAIIAAAIAVAPSYAADGPGARGPGGPHGPGGGPEDHGMQRPHRLPSEHVEARLAYMKTALKITDAQSRLWNALADVVRKHAKQRDAEMQAMTDHRREHDEHAVPDLVQMLERRQQHAAAEAANQAELLTAAKPLFATFSDDQKREAVGLLIPHRPHGFGPR